MLQNTRPRLRHVSLPAYLSGRRKTHDALGLGKLPTSDQDIALKAVCDGYTKASEGFLPPTDIRIALPAEIIYRIFLRGCVEGASLVVFRDSVLIIGATIYGLRPAGVQSVKMEHVTCGSLLLSVLVGSLKEKRLQEALRRGGRGFYIPGHSPEGYTKAVQDLITIWHDQRGTGDGRWFEAPGLSVANLNRAIKKATESLGWAPPQGCSVGGHCLRVSDFTQSVLLGWSPIRLQIRFDWKNVSDMKGVYMDHRSRVYPASLVFFSAEIPQSFMEDGTGAD